MLQIFRNLSLFQRLLVSFLLAAVVPGLIIILGYISYTNSNTSYNTARTNASELLSYTQRIQQDLHLMNVLASKIATYSDDSNDPRELDAVYRFQAVEPNVGSELKHLADQYDLSAGSKVDATRSYLLSRDPNHPLVKDHHLSLLSANTVEWPIYASVAEKIAGSSDPLAKYQDSTKSYHLLSENIQHLVDDAVQVNVQIDQYRQDQLNNLYLTMVTVSLIFIVIFSIIGFGVSRAIIEPFRQLEIWTRRIAKEDFNIRAPEMGLGEIDLVAQSINSMLDRTVYLMQKAQDEHTLLQNQVEHLLNEVSVVGEGNLSVRAGILPGSMGVLGTSFNYMIDELSSLVVRIKGVAYEVDQLTSVALDRMAQLFNTNGVQMNRMNIATVEMERMSQLSRMVADRAQLLFQMSTTALQNAQVGRKAMHEVINGMDRVQQNVTITSEKVSLLGDRSLEISNAIKDIADIVHQTNKFALDASIQAALAGREGQAFAAVAADIRRLAERASEQTGSITQIAKRIQEDISVTSTSVHEMEVETSRDVPLTRNAGVALESIFSAIEREAKEIEHIALMATQQLRSASTVVSTFNAMARDTQQGNISTHVMADQTRTLVPLVHQIRTSVEVFRLRQDAKFSEPGMTPSSQNVANTGDTRVQQRFPGGGLLTGGRFVSGSLTSPQPATHKPAGYNTRQP